MTFTPPEKDAANNGGSTSYYDLPLPDEEKIAEIIQEVLDGKIGRHYAVTAIIDLCPKTLNDLIEYKKMAPWQHEVFKANYALEERALKNPEKGSSKIREVNKIIYYAKRGLNILLKEIGE